MNNKRAVIQIDLIHMNQLFCFVGYNDVMLKTFFKVWKEKLNSNLLRDKFLNRIKLWVLIHSNYIFSIHTFLIIPRVDHAILSLTNNSQFSFHFQPFLHQSLLTEFSAWGAVISTSTVELYFRSCSHVSTWFIGPSTSASRERFQKTWFILSSFSEISWIYLLMSLLTIMTAQTFFIDK